MENSIKKPIVLPENVVTDLAFEKLLKDFINKTKREGILEEVKAHRYYVKPSTKKRLKQKEQRNVR